MELCDIVEWELSAIKGQGNNNETHKKRGEVGQTSSITIITIAMVRKDKKWDYC